MKLVLARRDLSSWDKRQVWVLIMKMVSKKDNITSHY